MACWVVWQSWRPEICLEGDWILICFFFGLSFSELMAIWVGGKIALVFFTMGDRVLMGTGVGVSLVSPNLLYLLVRAWLGYGCLARYCISLSAKKLLLAAQQNLWIEETLDFRRVCWACFHQVPVWDLSKTCISRWMLIWIDKYECFSQWSDGHFGWITTC